MAPASHLSNSGTVIVFGGSGGLGASICQALASNGHEIALTYGNDKDKADALIERLTSAGIKARAFRTNTQDHDSVAGTVDEVAREFGGINHVIYASGPMHPVKKLSDVSVEEWNTCIDAHVKGFFYVFRSTLNHLQAAGGGTYVALTTAAISRYINNDATSAVPKSAVELMIRAIASEEGRNGIRANCVAPGVIGSGSLTEHMNDPSTRKLIDRISESLPLCHLGDAVDIAEAVLFLISERSKYITGQTVHVDGGMSI